MAPLARQVRSKCQAQREYARWGNYWHTPGFITPADWLVERDRILNEYCPVRSDVLLAQLRNVQPQLYPDLDAPVFLPWGGSVAIGAELTLSGPSGATIYYTTDSKDPRLEGGAVSPSAQVYSAPFTLSAPVATVLARAFDGVEWSALERASYAVGVSLRINELMAKNATTVQDEAGEYEDWVELVNLSACWSESSRRMAWSSFSSANTRPGTRIPCW